MQLDFVAGGFGLIGRDLLFYLTVQNWEPLVLSELFFASFIFLGFILHTIGFAKVGVILSCLAGVGSATAFIFMLGWNSFFHLWYINLAILIIAVPLDIRLKVFLALIFISIYSSMFLLFSDLEPFYKIENTTLSILGLSNIIGSLLVLGLPMGMYSLFLEQERNRSEKLLHNIMPKSIADQLKKDSKLISMTAARLESYGSPDCIHMTKTTYELLNYKEKKVEEKSIEIRGKGLMDTVLVNVQ